MWFTRLFPRFWPVDCKTLHQLWYLTRNQLSSKTNCLWKMYYLLLRWSKVSTELIKVDLRKAFDSVNWDFIIQILRTADFPPVFINWISQCLTTTSFSINVNGELCGFFKGTRGLRQGEATRFPLRCLSLLWRSSQTFYLQNLIQGLLVSIRWEGILR